jgi:DNA-binding CsgD family transcriptional regulator
MLSKLMYVIVEIYTGKNFTEYTPLLLALKTIKSIGVSLFLLILPVMINHIMLVTLTRTKKIVLSAVSVFVFLEYVLARFFHIEVPYSYVISNSLFIIVIVYCILTVVMNLKEMTDKRQKKIISTFLVLAVVFLPMSIFDFINGETSIQIPVYFIVLNILGVIFSIFYLLPPSVVGKDKLIDYLKEKYNITDREYEVISQMQKGCSNNEMSDKFMISISTVEKHINSIYRKLNLKNRVQLINFIQSGMK